MRGRLNNKVALALTMLGFLGLLASLWSLRKYNDAIMLGTQIGRAHV